MVFDDNIVVCNCGFGDGFYHRASDSIHEYNPFVSVEQGCASQEADRKPLATFFGHIDGRRVVLCVNDFPGAVLKKDMNEYSYNYADNGKCRRLTMAKAAKSLVADAAQITLI